MEFKVGDRVYNHAGSLGYGTVLVIQEDGEIGVEFDTPLSYDGGLSLGGRCNENYGYWIDDPSVLSLIKRVTHVCGLICKCNAKEAVTF